MRLWMTGGTGFVGSNIMMAALNRGHQVMTTVHRFIAPADARYETEQVDMVDAAAVRSSVEAFRPDLVVHCAIMNDLAGMYANRRAGWDAYVEATRSTLAAAQAVDAAYVFISTDWVFDGTQGGADESTPPNPINLYGMYKFAGELITIEGGGAVARLSGVNGLHRCRPESPRGQDPGFGYFVASIADTLRIGKPFTVWESDKINMLATPSLASESAEMILEIGQRGSTGIFHCCGADIVGRMELAELTCDVFSLDRGLLVSGPPPPGSVPDVPIPYDTSITRPRTTEVLEGKPSSVGELLQRFRQEYEAAL